MSLLRYFRRIPSEFSVSLCRRFRHSLQFPSLINFAILAHFSRIFPLVQQLSTKIGGHAQVDSTVNMESHIPRAHRLFPCLAIGPFLLRSSCTVLVHL
jgi:hypothetical protein